MSILYPITDEQKRLQAKIAIAKGYTLVDGMRNDGDGKVTYPVRRLVDPKGVVLHTDAPTWSEISAFAHYPMPCWMWDWRDLKALIQEFPSPTKYPSLMWTGERWLFRMFPFVDDTDYYNYAHENEFVAVGTVWLDWQKDAKEGKW